MRHQDISPMEKVMRWLSRRGYSGQELAEKLRRAGVDEFSAEKTVEECRRLGFVNDELFARDCAGVLASRGCGRLRIKADLRRRGVSEYAPEVLEELEESELERAVEAARFKRRLLARETDSRKLREKLWRFLLGRGFTPDTVREAVRLSGLDDEEMI